VQLLDEGNFEFWLAMHAPDIEYVAHIQSDIVQDKAGLDKPHQLTCLAERAQTLQLRVLKIRTGLQQTEVPASRTVRLISSVRVREAESNHAYHVRSAFILYRNQRHRDGAFSMGCRRVASEHHLNIGVKHNAVAAHCRRNARISHRRVAQVEGFSVYPQQSLLERKPVDSQ